MKHILIILFLFVKSLSAQLLNPYMFNSAPTLNTNLFGAYNSNYTTTDTVAGNNGIATAITYTTGITGGYAFNFNGTSSLIDLAANSWNFTGDFSVSFWAKVPSGISGSRDYVIASNTSFISSSSSGWQIEYNTYGGPYIAFIYFNSGSQVFCYSSAATLLSITHVVVVVKSLSNVKIYINGALSSTTAITLPISYASPCYSTFGVKKTQTSPSGISFFKGFAGTIQFWNRELTSTDVTNLYNSGNGLSAPF